MQLDGSEQQGCFYVQLNGCRTSSLKWGYVPSLEAFPGTGLLCVPFWNHSRLTKILEGGRTSRCRLPEHFNGSKHSARIFFFLILAKTCSSIYISSIILTLKYDNTTRLHQPALELRSTGSQYLMEHCGNQRNQSLLRSDRSLHGHEVSHP